MADVLSETDAFGIHSHGTKNLPGYIQKIRAGGIDIHAEPEIILNAASLATIDARRAIGMVPAVQAMDIACQKANHTGLALITVCNSCHFGAAGYYANMAAKRGMIGIAMSNVDPNMTIPGARGMVIGNNPFAYAAPMENGESMFLDIAMSNVASLKVVQARKDRRQIPDNWIVDKNGVPTTDPSPVSYTHLDVYKRQGHCHLGLGDDYLKIFREHTYNAVCRTVKQMETLLECGFTSMRECGGLTNYLKPSWSQGVISGPRIFSAGRSITPVSYTHLIRRKKS